jgi:hypothetical protein
MAVRGAQIADSARLTIMPMMQLASLIKSSSVISFPDYRLHGLERARQSGTRAGRKIAERDGDL